MDVNGRPGLWFGTVDVSVIKSTIQHSTVECLVLHVWILGKEESLGTSSKRNYKNVHGKGQAERLYKY